MPLVQTLDNTFNSLFDRMVDSPYAAAQLRSPPVDIERTDNALLVYMDLPGMSKDAIDVRFQDGVLEVKGTRETRTEEAYIAQRWKGEFQRRIRIKDPIDAAEVSASYLDGVLTITLPHRAPPDRVRVTVA